MWRFFELNNIHNHITSDVTLTPKLVANAIFLSRSNSNLSNGQLTP